MNRSSDLDRIADRSIVNVAEIRERGLIMYDNLQGATARFVHTFSPFIVVIAVGTVRRTERRHDQSRLRLCWDHDQGGRQYDQRQLRRKCFRCEYLHCVLPKRAFPPVEVPQSA